MSFSHTKIMFTKVLLWVCILIQPHWNRLGKETLILYKKKNDLNNDINLDF